MMAEPEAVDWRARAETVRELLQKTGFVTLVVDASRPDVRVPGTMRGIVNLKAGVTDRNAARPLVMDEQGVMQRQVFEGIGDFDCLYPWASIYIMVEGRGGDDASLVVYFGHLPPTFFTGLATLALGPRITVPSVLVQPGAKA